MGLFKLPIRSLRCGRVDIMDYGSENMPRIELVMIISSEKRNCPITPNGRGRKWLLLTSFCVLSDRILPGDVCVLRI